MVIANNKGLTLIELMIVVIVIAIMASIAYPSYQDSVRKTRRVEMQSTMQDIAVAIQRYKIANFTVIGATASDLGISESYPTQGTAFYNVSLMPIDSTSQKLTSNNWILTATPKTGGMQVLDGSLVINSLGQKCWIKGSTCTPSETTNWDGN